MEKTTGPYLDLCSVVRNDHLWTGKSNKGSCKGAFINDVWLFSVFQTPLPSPIVCISIWSFCFCIPTPPPKRRRDLWTLPNQQIYDKVRCHSAEYVWFIHLEFYIHFCISGEKVTKNRLFVRAHYLNGLQVLSFHCFKKETCLDILIATQSTTKTNTKKYRFVEYIHR